MNAYSSSRRFVLVIDDNRDAANTAAMLIRCWGFEVAVAYDATRGLEAARARRPDCVLSDIGLPDFDGYELARQFRQDEFLSSVPLIALSANADEDIALAAGFAKVLVKPADLSILERVVRQFVAPVTA